MPFLRENEAVINLKNSHLILDGHWISCETKAQKEFRKGPDGWIVKRNHYNNITRKKDKKEFEKLVNKYKSNNSKMGNMRCSPMEIKLKQIPSKNQRPYPLPIKPKEPVKREISRFPEQGIIRKSTANFASPCFPIIKKNGQIRLVVDYRELNRCTFTDSYPFPNITEHLAELKHHTIFSQIDLQQGYYKIPVEEKSKKFTSFLTNEGQYEFNRMPFGLKNAPRKFHQAICEILGDMPFVKIFLDDILISSESIKQHTLHVKRVLEKLWEHNIAINWEKTNLFKESVKYLGHILTD